ncbi:MAG: hypothetical protein WBW32_03175 [Luteibacter sp.]
MHARSVYSLILVACGAGMLAGCGATVDTFAVRPEDTPLRWDRAMASMPFLLHFPDGRMVAYDQDGRPWPGVHANDLSHISGHVEMFVGPFQATGSPMCSAHPTLSRVEAGARIPNLAVVLCDHERAVDAFSDTVPVTTLGAPATLTAHARQLLLEGIQDSSAQQPEI